MPADICGVQPDGMLNMPPCAERVPHLARRAYVPFKRRYWTVPEPVVKDGVPGIDRPLADWYVYTSNLDESGMPIPTKRRRDMHAAGGELDSQHGPQGAHLRAFRYGNEGAAFDVPCDKADRLGGSVCVFYTKSPLAASAPEPFILDGRYYYSVEHYFQLQLMYAFGMFKLASEAITIPDMHDFRKKVRMELRRLIKAELFDEFTLTKWKHQSALRLMRRGSRTKCDQNAQLRALLLHTGERLLIYADKRDKLLGVGMSEAEFLFWARKNELSLENLLDMFTGRIKRPRELGQNLLGIALMELRAEYADRTSIYTLWKQEQEDESRKRRRRRSHSRSRSRSPKRSRRSRSTSKSKRSERRSRSKSRDRHKKGKKRKDRDGRGEDDKKGGQKIKAGEEKAPASGKEAASPPSDKVCVLHKAVPVSTQALSDDERKMLKGVQAAMRDKRKWDDTRQKRAAKGKPATCLVDHHADSTAGGFEATGGATGLASGQAAIAAHVRQVVDALLHAVCADQLAHPVCQGEQHEAPTPAQCGDTEAGGTQITVLKEQRRIIISRPKAFDSAPLSDVKVSRWGPEKPAEEVADALASTSLVPPPDVNVDSNLLDLESESDDDDQCDGADLTTLERLRRLTRLAPMINPYSAALTSAERERLAGDSAPPVPMGAAAPVRHDLADDEHHVPPEVEIEQVVYKPPPGRPYWIEQGEVAPIGVIMPPPHLDDAVPILLPASMRPYIHRPLLPPTKPAALPAQLLPLPPPPPGVDPLAWRQRFADPPKRLHPYDWAMLNKYSPFGPIPRYVIAPSEREVDNMVPKEWKPPTNPVKEAVAGARRFMAKFRRMRLIARQRRLISQTSDEGSTPAAIRRLVKANGGGQGDAGDDDEEKDFWKALATRHSQMFPFGLATTLNDLHKNGFVPPPIVGNPKAQMRNKKLVKDWLTQFKDPEAALRHYANRWLRGGRLNMDGTYEEVDENGAMPDYEHEESDDEELQQWRRTRRRVQTKVVYLDTAQYDQYARWYQKEHGLTPLPDDGYRHMEQLRLFYRQYRRSLPVAQAQFEQRRSEQQVRQAQIKQEMLDAENNAAAHSMGCGDDAQPAGDYWALNRWRWTEWERHQERGEAAKNLYIKQEVEVSADGCHIAAKPVKYECDDEHEFAVSAECSAIADCVVEEAQSAAGHGHNAPAAGGHAEARPASPAKVNATAAFEERPFIGPVVPFMPPTMQPQQQRLHDDPLDDAPVVIDFR